MAMKTLITDGFDEGQEWLDADDVALLKHTLAGIVEKYVMKHEEAAKARMVEPGDQTVLFLAGGPPDFPRIWIRNDLKRSRFGPGGLNSGQRWQREGNDDWYDWNYVLKVTKRGRLITLIEGDFS